MFYLTYIQDKINKDVLQINIDDLFNDTLPEINPIQQKHLIKKTILINENIHDDKTTEVYTGFTKTKTIMENIILFGKSVTNTQENLTTVDMSVYYKHFTIPKASGGVRQINAPKDEIKLLLKRLQQFFMYDLKMLPTEAAYAYTQGRSHIAALQKHQSTGARWFLKLDLKDFFPSHNMEYILNQFSKIYPTCFYIQDESWKDLFIQVIHLCLLNNELPQGSPVSPFLTNVLMTPIDYAITQYTIEHENFMLYTRYADDILITSPQEFRKNDTEQKIIDILQEQNTPFTVKKEKTRFGSNAGRNWNLGIMYNKDNELTMGHKANQIMRATIFKFINDNLTNENRWTILEVQQFLGKINYYRQVEPGYINSVINKYNRKFNTDINELAKSLINRNVTP